jgi:hypothetical protein
MIRLDLKELIDATEEKMGLVKETEKMVHRKLFLPRWQGAGGVPDWVTACR